MTLLVFVAPDTLITSLPEFEEGDELSTAGPEEVTCMADSFPVPAPREFPQASSTNNPPYRPCLDGPQRLGRELLGASDARRDGLVQRLELGLPRLQSRTESNAHWPAGFQEAQECAEEEATEFFDADEFAKKPAPPIDWDDDDEPGEPTWAAAVEAAEPAFLEPAALEQRAPTEADIAATQEAMRAFEQAAMHALEAAEAAIANASADLPVAHYAQGTPSPEIVASDSFARVQVAPAFAAEPAQRRHHVIPPVDPADVPDTRHASFHDYAAEFADEDQAETFRAAREDSLKPQVHYEVPWFVTNNPPSPEAQQAKKKFPDAVPQTLMTIPAEQARALGMSQVKERVEAKKSATDADCRPKLMRWLSSKKRK